MKKNKSLGRGLDALLGEIDEAYENESSNKDVILELDVADIKPNPYQPRKEFDQETLLELANSIKKDGLIQPIVVTQELDGYVLIAGERRLRASKLANLPTIKAIVLNVDEKQVRSLALIENIQRDELNPVELAYAYEELLKVYEFTHEELSTKIHKNRTHITNTLRLLQLSKYTQDALIAKKITAGHAKVLVGLSERDQMLIVNSIIGQKLTVREVEAMIKSMKNQEKKEETSTPKVEVKSYDFSALKSSFENVGLKHKISKNKLTIEFESQEEVEKLLQLLKK